MDDDTSEKGAKKKPSQNEKTKEVGDDEIPTSTKTLVLKAPKIPTSIQRYIVLLSSCRNSFVTFLRSTYLRLFK